MATTLFRVEASSSFVRLREGKFRAPRIKKKMISQFERFCFLGGIRVYTYRNLFKNDVPTGIEVFKQLRDLHNGGSVHIMVSGQKSIKIHQFDISAAGHAEVLFQMTDPSIPDNVLSDRDSGGLRVAGRKQTEDPAVSAHIVVDLNSRHDLERTYPTCIENIDYLSRSLIVQYFNEWMAAQLSKPKVRKGEKEAKTHQPRFEFIAPGSQTIQSLLDNGGVLKGVKWVEDELVEQSFGDKAYPVIKRNDVGMTVKNRPTGAAAKKILGELTDAALGKKPKAVKVTIEDGNERTKTIGIDPSVNNVLSNVFIPQARFDEFKPPMAMCEAQTRRDLVDKMIKALIP